jgi:competence protein ComEA
LTTQTLVNINTATLDELVAVPGIGPALAKRILDHRPYQEINDLVQVSGIGETSLEDLVPYLTVETEEIQTVNLQIGTDEEFSTEENPPLETVDTEVLPSEDNEIYTNDLEDEEAIMSKNEAIPITDEIFYDLPEEEMAKPGSVFEEVDVIEEKELPTEEKSSQPAEEKQTAAAEKKPSEVEKGKDEPEYVTRQQLTWSVIAAVVTSVILTIALTLGILAFMNGDLRYATWNDAKHLSNQITGLSERSDSLQTEADQMRKRMDAMETVAGRVTVLEETTQTMQDNLTETQTQLESAQKTIAEIQDTMSNIQQRIDDYNNGFLGIYNAILPLVEPMLEGGQNK